MDVEDADESFDWANRALVLNPYLFDAYDVKAKTYAQQEQWQKEVEAKEMFLFLRPLQGKEYDEYLMYIHFALQQAAQRNDADACLALADKALCVPENMERVEQALSPLAYRLGHVPTLTLSDQSLNLVAYLESFRDTILAQVNP